MGRTFWGISGIFLLAGCIPPNADVARRNAPQLDQPQMETLYEEEPVWEARPVEASARNVISDSYTVQAGDTLSAIAVKTGAPVASIAAANQLSEPYIIKPGQTLTIPGGRFHIVAQGESGIAIARAYSIPWSEIVTINGLAEPFLLKIGQRLKLPEPAPATALPSMEVRAAAFKLDIDDIITGGEPAQTAATPHASNPEAFPERALPPSVVVREPTSFSGRFIWPVNGAVVSRFGAAGATRNDGIEIGTPVGTQIRAASDGVVAYVGNGVSGYGGLILLRHGNGWITAYGRASEAQVTRGQTVKQGQVIGRTGDFGSAAGPQLHFEIRQGRTPVDPLKHLPPKA